jgi:hypothetical protein
LAEKRILIVPAALAQKIDDNRGDMSRDDFIEFLIDSQLKPETKDKQSAAQYATKEEVQSLEQDIKRLLKSFLDFFLNYGLEIGKQSKEDDLEEITAKLEELQKDTDQGNEKGRATIKWK